MFGYFTYPAKVGSALLRRGWSPDTLPNSLDPAWGAMIRAMRSNGVPVDIAANWLDGALQGDETSIDKVDAKSGVYGMMFFGTREQRANGMKRHYTK